MAGRIGALIVADAPHLRLLAEALERGELRASIEMVVAFDAGGGGKWAQAAGLRTAIFDRSEISSRARRQEAARRVFEASEVDLVVCADFDEPLGETLLSAFPERIVSVWPSLLPAFDDVPDPVAAAVEAGLKVTGSTAHLVAVDSRFGPILVQRVVEVRDVDTEETLRDRLELESSLALVEAVRLIVDGRVRVSGRRTRII
jgi:phosphoribosylglycinamide formyltransferase-1